MWCIQKTLGCVDGYSWLCKRVVICIDKLRTCYRTARTAHRARPGKLASASSPHSYPHGLTFETRISDKW